METSPKDLDVGDLCFAHVKSYPWWPAQIVATTEKKSGKNKLFSLIFFGTNEIAKLPIKELIGVSSLSIAKYVTKASLKRKFFKEGFEEMMKKREQKPQDVSEELISQTRISKQEFLAQFALKESVI